MKYRYPLESQRTHGFECLDANCDRKAMWSLESSPMSYRAYACRGHLEEICEELAIKGDTCVRVARQGTIDHGLIQ